MATRTITASVDNDDVMKLEYLGMKHHLESHKGFTAVIRLAIKKAYAHEKMLEGETNADIRKGHTNNP